MTQQAPDKINVFWFLPTHGDGRYLGTTEGGRPVDLPYLQQMALAADSLGYYGVLIPTGKSCEDSWLVASALAPLTRRLRYLVAVRPGLQPPTLAARMAATLDRLSEGRLLINVVTGGDPVENKGDGIFLSHSERYQVTREFLDVYTRLLRGKKWIITASIFTWKALRCCSRRCRRMARRSISAALLMRPLMWRPSRSTAI